MPRFMPILTGIPALRSIPGIHALPFTPLIELETLTTLLPLTVPAIRDRSDYEDQDLARFATHGDQRAAWYAFADWTAQGARAQLITWGERDRWCRIIASAARETGLVHLG